MSSLKYDAFIKTPAKQKLMIETQWGDIWLDEFPAALKTKSGSEAYETKMHAFLAQYSQQQPDLDKAIEKIQRIVYVRLDGNLTNGQPQYAVNHMLPQDIACLLQHGDAKVFFYNGQYHLYEDDADAQDQAAQIEIDVQALLAGPISALRQAMTSGLNATTFTEIEKYLAKTTTDLQNITARHQSISYRQYKEMPQDVKPDLKRLRQE